MTEQRIWRWTALALVTMALALAWNGLSPRATANAITMAPPTTTSVISLRGALEKLDERVVREEELKSEIEKREKVIKDLQEELENLAALLDEMVPGSDERAEKLEEAVRLQVQIEFETNFANRMLGQQRTEMQLALFNKIREATKAYAAGEGWDIVLVTDHESEIPNGLAPNEVNGAILSRRVIHASPSVDITDEVAQRMNNEFKR